MGFEVASRRWCLAQTALLVLARTAMAAPAAGAAAAHPLVAPAPEGPGFGVSVVTWNLAQCSPVAADCGFLRHLGSSSLVVLGAQEVEDLKPRRHEGRRSRALRGLLLTRLKREGFQPVVMTSLGGIHLHVFVRKDSAARLDLGGIRTWEVACGVGNVLQNKGALGVQLEFAGRTLVFVTAHLAAHQAKVRQRNNDFWRIMQESDLALSTTSGEGTSRSEADADAGEDEWANRRRTVQQRPRSFQLSEPPPGASPRPPSRSVDLPPTITAADVVVFFGDLNYRLDLTREEVELTLTRSGLADGSRPAFRALLDFDQLARVRASGDAFVGFSEGPIAFAPTFKFDKGTDRYDTSDKRRVPAWTDRVLFRAARGVLHLRKYGVVDTSKHSDHRPVCAQFHVTTGPGPGLGPGSTPAREPTLLQQVEHGR